MDKTLYKSILNSEDIDNFFNDIITSSLLGITDSAKIKYARNLINEKIWMLLKQSKYYILEEEYVELEWKEMISFHYVNTTYNFENTVCRIHLFTDNKNIESDYLGFFTLRKIDEPTILFSKMYPNWKNLSVDNTRINNAHITAVEKVVHIFDNEIKIMTTPYFVQDGVVTCCAHSTILMLTNFLNLQYGYNKVTITNIINSFTFSRERNFPVKGLNIPQMSEVLFNNGISSYVNSITNKNNEESRYCVSTIISQIDSNIPVIMGFGSHSVLIIGYFTKNDGSIEFVFYDDSGTLISKINQENLDENGQIYSNFIYSFNESMLKPTNNSPYIFFFIQPERVYSRNYDVETKCNHLFRRVSSEIISPKIFIADISTCKQYLKEHCIDECRNQELSKFYSLSKPHYIWCYEFEFRGAKMIYFVDSTYNKLTPFIKGLNGKKNKPFVVNEYLTLNLKLQSDEFIDIPKFSPKPVIENSILSREHSYATNVGRPAPLEDDDLLCDLGKLSNGTQDETQEN